MTSRFTCPPGACGWLHPAGMVFQGSDRMRQDDIQKLTRVLCLVFSCPLTFLGPAVVMVLQGRTRLLGQHQEEERTLIETQILNFGMDFATRVFGFPNQVPELLNL